MDTIVIDIQAQYQDKTSAGVSKTQQGIDKLHKSIQKLSGGKYEAKVSLLDKASGVISQITAKLGSMIQKPWNFTVGMFDKITSPLRNIYNFATSLKGILTGLVV